MQSQNSPEQPQVLTSQPGLPTMTTETTTTTTETTTQTPPPEQPKKWGDRVGEWMARMRIGGWMEGLRHSQRMNNQVEINGARHAAANHELLYGDKGQDEAAMVAAQQMGEDDMQLGDNNYPPAQVIPIMMPQQQAAAPQPSAPESLLRKVLPLAIGLGLGGTGVGAGLAGLNYLLNRDTDPPPAVQPGDRLGLGADLEDYLR